METLWNIVLQKQSKKYPECQIEKRILSLTPDKAEQCFKDLIEKYPQKAFYMWTPVGSLSCGYPQLIAKTNSCVANW